MTLLEFLESLSKPLMTMQQGGGIGYDFSTLRPKGALVSSVGADASGPISFMDVMGRYVPHDYECWI